MNLLNNANNSLINKEWSNGLSSYTQSHCQCTLTDDGYRIYRTPNKTVSGDGYVMWGGFVLSNSENRFGLQKGHTYIISMEIKGQSSNNICDIYWSNNVGWGGGGLDPNPSNVYIANPVISNFTNSQFVTLSYKFTINDDIYKVCTSSYSSFVQGNTYLSYNGFKVGFGYTDTGSLGTDLYIKNLRMYDLTSNTAIYSINKSGILEGAEFIEQDGEVQINNTEQVFATEFTEI